MKTFADLPKLPVNEQKAIEILIALNIDIDVNNKDFDEKFAKIVAILEK